MGIEISGLGTINWEELYALAIRYGWEPIGTVKEFWVDRETGKKHMFQGTANGEWKEDPNWEGGYFTNDYQYVRPEDALNMGKALKRALVARLSSDSPLDWVEGTERMIVRCMRGGFYIK